MASKPIIIYVFSNGNEGLVFSNKPSGGELDPNPTTDVECKDVVTWKAMSQGLALTDIEMKPGAPSIWSPGKEPGKYLTGTICQTAAGKTAAYSVIYTIDGVEQPPYDPKIKVTGGG